jgi:tripartite-type tricarboxylate transporter receptor subunit TctC
MESSAWFGLWAPAGVPAGVVDRIANDVERAVASPEVMEKLAKMGAEPMRMTPSEFARFVRTETETSRNFVRELGIKPQPYVAPAKP